jgi:hypothetical protein
MQIAGRCRPSQVRLLVDRMGIQWIPIPAPGSPLMSPATDLRLANHKKPIDAKPKSPSGASSKPKSNAKTSAKTPPVQVASNARNRNRPG